MSPSIEVYLAATQASEGAPTLLDLLFVDDPVVLLVLLVLLGMSLACWAIIGMKGLRLRKAHKVTTTFLDRFWASKRLDGVYADVATYEGSPVAAVFKAGYREYARVSQSGGDPVPNVTRALRRSAQVEILAMRRFISFLATTGATAPFIGLFGTVWGILTAFMKLGAPGATATIQVVGPDIAHALVATAVGLVAAIPAVWAFNGFNGWIEMLETEMDNFSSDFLNLLRRG